MAVRKISENVFAVGVQDWDRRLFDELIPLPDGTSYNSYLIKGSEKTALLDSVDPARQEELIHNLQELGIKQIDYLVAHHGEQDHSGGIPRVLEAYPEAKVVTNPKCQAFLIDLLHIPAEKFQPVNDRETLSLGDKTLEFIIAPWVHWPETMFTYLRQEQIIFTCDFFGSHQATSELYAADEGKVYEAAKRYYAEIMMPFRTIIRKNLEKIQDLPIKLIAPSHGPVYNKPEFIRAAYSDWSSEQVKNEVVLPFVSMHHSTRIMADYLIEALIKRGITVKPFNLTVTDLGELAVSLVDSATLVLGSPTVLAGPHPQAVYAAFLANALRPKLRFASLFGSYLWNEGVVERISGMLGNLKIEVIPPVMIKGLPKVEDLKLLDNLAEQILQKHKEIGIV